MFDTNNISTYYNLDEICKRAKNVLIINNICLINKNHKSTHTIFIQLTQKKERKQQKFNIKSQKQTFIRDIHFKQNFK